METHPLGKNSMTSCNVLILGMQNSGKTLLVKQLIALSKGKDITNHHPDCFPTVGVNLDEISIRKKKFIIREVGGSMVSTWHRYILDCQSIMLAASCVELYSVILQLRKHAISKKILILLTKCDAPCVFSRSHFEDIFLLQQVKECYQKKKGGNLIRVVEISSFSGENLQMLINWIWETSQ